MEKGKLNFEGLKKISGHDIQSVIFKKDTLNGIIPGKTKVRLKFLTFCMDEGKLAPDVNEPYIFSYEMLDMPMFFKIMFYFNSHPQIGSDFRQQLIWKLCKKPKFYELSKEEQEFLFKIDEFADSEVNNYKSVKYSDWKGIEKENWPENIFPQQIPGTEIYAKFIKINGFSEAEVEFYNPLEKEQVLVLLKTNPGTLAGKFFNSVRQRLGFTTPGGNTGYFEEGGLGGMIDD